MNINTLLIIGSVIGLILAGPLFYKIGHYQNWLEIGYIPPEKEYQKNKKEDSLLSCAIVILACLAGIVFLWLFINK